MEEKLEQTFNMLQGLQIKPTLTNMEILVQSLYNIREVYNKLKEGGTDGGTMPNSGGRNND